MTQFETRRIRIGSHEALLRVEVSPAGIGRVEVAWTGAAPGRLSSAEWQALRDAKARLLDKLAGIYGVKEG